jgi:hypothetical protein
MSTLEAMHKFKAQMGDRVFLYACLSGITYGFLLNLLLRVFTLLNKTKYIIFESPQSHCNILLMGYMFRCMENMFMH